MTKLYNAWCNMKSRCYNTNHPNYDRYGGRGIEVCDRWVNSFDNFREDMEAANKPGLTLERTDTNGSYEPSNCKWVTQLNQCRNQVRSKLWWIDGVCYDSSRQAAEELGISPKTIRRWCDGRNKTGAPKKGCYSELKYNTEVTQ